MRWMRRSRRDGPGDQRSVATGGQAVCRCNDPLDVDKPLTVRSVNGPQFTVINGGGTNGCVHVSDGASVSGFTLTNALQFPL